MPTSAEARCDQDAPLPPEPRARAAWTGVLWSAGAGLAVGLAGGFATPAVWILAMISAVVFRSLSRRSREEEASEADPLGLFLQIAFLALLCAAASDHRDPARPQFGAPELLGLGLIALGTWLRQSALNALGSQFTVHLRVAPGHRLVRSGPYRLIRHPNYAGLLLVAFGTALGFSSPRAIAVAAFLWLPAMLARIVQEERLLMRNLGADYAGYARTTWRLVPGLY